MIKVRLEGIEAALRAFDPRLVTKAAGLSIDEAGDAARVAAKKELLAKWNLKPSRVDKELRKVRVTRTGNIEAVIEAKGRPISLMYFGFKEKRRTVKGKGGKYRQVKGVTGAILKNEGGVSYLGAFMATMVSGHKGVFMSQKRFFGRPDYNYGTPTRGRYAGQKGRTPVVSLATVTIATMFGQAPVQEAAKQAAEERFASRFNHHLKRLQG